MDKVRGIHDGLSDRIPQQHKDAAHDHLAHGRQFLSEEYFPEERHDQFIYRGKKVRKPACCFVRSLLILLFGCRLSSSARSTRIIKSLSSGSYPLPKSTLLTGRLSLGTAKRGKLLSFL
jgi:hypothetical protein